ncbi:PAS domain S-box protein [Azospirillum halopraeferens]|uniref:PAS domain S-box protein n=1 Tax=Azospirillum halopraeferens TaxID=34010 RepID=UPI000411DE5A|nr:PAS domain S-box protein [Azospirillum halopraeferens]
MSALTLIAAGVALLVGVAGGFVAGRRWPARTVLDARLGRVLDTAPVGVIINTREGANLYRNVRARDFFRKTDAEFESGGVVALYARPGDRDRYIERLYRDGSIVEEEVLLRKGTGETYVGDMTSAVLTYGGRTAHITWFHDLTPRKEADAVRRDLAERLEMALEATNAAAWDADVVNRTCWWSDTFPRMLGYATPPPMGPDFWEERLHPDDRDRVLAVIAACLDGEGAEYAYGYRLRCEDGTWIWIDARGRVLRDEAGRAVRYVGIMTDVTERRRQEDKLKASEDRLHRILEASPIACNITRHDGRWLYCNASSALVFGRTRDELMETPSPALYADPEDRVRLMDRLRREGPFRDAEVAFRRGDGSLVWVLSSWGEILFDGEPALLTWLYDITDRRAGEEELRAAKVAAERALADLRVAQDGLIRAEAMASLGELVAGVAHEINTPVGIGLTAATHLADQTRGLRERFAAGAIRRSDLAQYLDAVEEGTRLLVVNIARAAELVNSFKQVAVDQSSGERRRFDLRTHIGEVLFSLRPRLKRTAVTVDVSCPEGITMDSHPGPLAQVLSNLTINAVIHAFPDGAAGHVRITVQRLEDGFVGLEFADDGVGIAPADLERIFEPFYTTRRGDGGSGLGLHIVRNMVTDLLGGRVTVDSAPGEGTRFTLILPCTAPQASATAEEAVVP